uniref:Glycosyltransferase RgtA/B/C/D-like domain-containing protein n=1 Tax=Solibacter usitatus (strain Ellin6076) TaxID=234267 RepID=Q01Y55_SOLUE
MPVIRIQVIRRAVPILILLALYWPGVTTWFYQDDFGWLNLRHDVHSTRDLAAALFAPKAHGNMRPLGENAYWLAISSVFGPDPLPFHIAAFLIQAASLLLLGAIIERTVKSHLAAFTAQCLWVVNIGLAPALGWSSIFNQILSAFFFLFAFYFLLRCQWRAHWIAFLLGLGALEINVMYPAIAAVYALLYAPALLRKIAPMFAVSAVAVFLHFHFAPPPAAGVYAPRVDGRMLATFWTYWQWSLGPMPLWLALALTAAVVALIAGRQHLALFGLAFFVLPLLPYLPLPDHKMDYYLAVPAIGIALLGAAAVAVPRYRMAAAAFIAIYLGASLPAASRITRWQHARGERVEDLVLGVKEIRQSMPDGVILLDGIDTDLFWSGVADLPFRALAIPRVYLSPAPVTRIDAAPELLSKYTLPAALARNAVLYRFDGQQLHRSSLSAALTETEPLFVNLADDAFREYFGAGWRAAPGGYREMSGAATVRIGTPRTVSQSLYIGIFETRDFHLTVRANGVELPVTVAHRDNDLSEFRAKLPPAALSWMGMEVALSADRAPLTFGYLEVR